MGGPETARIFAAQMVAPPDLSGLPGWAQVLGYGIFVLSIVVLGLITRFGWKMGRTGPADPPQNSAAVAAVIVDPEALNRATDAVTALNGTMGRLTDLVGQIVADQHEERQEREIEDEVSRRVDKQLREQRTRQRRVAAAARAGGKKA